jgi:putative glutamine amidotransferase
MERKRIGIVGSKFENGFGVGLHNIEYMHGFGNVHIIMPWEEFNDKLDMIYLPGGLDVNPATYGQLPGFRTSNTDVFKQFFLEHRLKNYVDAGTPIFGVCLGFQQLNVFFGGKLIQDNPFHAQSTDRGVAAHKVITSMGDEFYVNSHHHQCVTRKNLSSELEVLAMSLTGGVVESFKHKQLPIVGVQWHPEEYFDSFSDSQIKSLLNDRKPATLLPPPPKKDKKKTSVDLIL